MRTWLIAGLLALSACASPPAVSTATLAAADAATTLAAGERLTLETAAHASAAGDDPLILLTLRHADGRTLAFEQANHAPNDLMAQAPGGPLSQVMGLLGEEAPTLYNARSGEHGGAPFLCAPEGPVALGYYEAADGSVQIVGLKQPIQFETRPDGQSEAVPYAPDHVCARLRFRRG